MNFGAADNLLVFVWSKGRVWKAEDVVCLLQKGVKLLNVELLTTMVSIVVKHKSPTKLSGSSLC